MLCILKKSSCYKSLFDFQIVNNNYILICVDVIHLVLLLIVVFKFLVLYVCHQHINYSSKKKAFFNKDYWPLDC